MYGSHVVLCLRKRALGGVGEVGGVHCCHNPNVVLVGGNACRASPRFLVGVLFMMYCIALMLET